MSGGFHRNDKRRIERQLERARHIAQFNRLGGGIVRRTGLGPQNRRPCLEGEGADQPIELSGGPKSESDPMEFEPPGFDQELSRLKIEHEIGLRTSCDTEFLLKQAVALRDIDRIGCGRRGVDRLNIERNSE